MIGRQNIRENRAINTNMIHYQNTHRLQSYGLVCFERWPITRTRAALSSLSLWLFDFNSSTFWKIRMYSPITNILPSADRSEKQAKALSLHLSRSSGLICLEPNTVQAHNKWQNRNRICVFRYGKCIGVSISAKHNQKSGAKNSVCSKVNNAQIGIRGTHFLTEKTGLS